MTHEDHKASKIKLPLNIIANDISSPQNVGSLFRLCDALAIDRLYLCGTTPIPPNTKINKTSRSTEKYVTFEQRDSAVKLVKELKQSEAYIISLEITASSIAIGSEVFSDSIKGKRPVYLILGSENSGVSDALLSLSDMKAHITMLGNNSSMNVISAASIACFEISRVMSGDM